MLHLPLLLFIVAAENEVVTVMVLVNLAEVSASSHYGFGYLFV